MLVFEILVKTLRGLSFEKAKVVKGLTRIINLMEKDVYIIAQFFVLLKYVRVCCKKKILSVFVL